MGRPARRRIDGTTKADFNTCVKLTQEQAAVALSVNRDFRRRHANTPLKETDCRVMIADTLANDSRSVRLEELETRSIIQIARRMPTLDVNADDPGVREIARVDARRLHHYLAALDIVATWPAFKQPH